MSDPQPSEVRVNGKVGTVGGKYRIANHTVSTDGVFLRYGDVIDCLLRKEKRQKFWRINEIYSIAPSEEKSTLTSLLEECYIDVFDKPLSTPWTWSDRGPDVDVLEFRDYRLAKKWFSKRYHPILKLMNLHRYDLEMFPTCENLGDVYRLLRETPYKACGLSPEVLAQVRGIPEMTKEEWFWHRALHGLYEHQRSNSHVCTPVEEWIGGCDVTPISDMVTIHDGHVYFSHVREIELRLASALSALIRSKPSTMIYCNDPLIDSILSNRISLVTGEAGTGKTTLLGKIVDFLYRMGIGVFVTSFTGKAVYRVRQVIKDYNVIRNGYPLVDAGTMDSALLKWRGRWAIFPYEVIIIDEISMVSNELMSRWLDRFNNHHRRFILVGDVNQLEPIGQGALLREIQPLIPVFRLEKNHRSDLDIVNVGRAILNGSTLPPQTRRFGHQEQSPLQFIINHLESLKKERFVFLCLRNYVVNQINTFCQRWFTGEPKEIHQLNVGDPVVVNQNVRSVVAIKNFDNGTHEVSLMPLFNGMDGRVVHIDNVSVVVRFGDRDVRFVVPYNAKKNVYVDGGGEEEIVVKEDAPPTSLLQLAYAMTIHKAQGSEWNVVIVVLEQKSQWMNRRTLYTAVTRAKSRLMILSDQRTLDETIRRQSPPRIDFLGKEILAVGC